MHLHGRGIGRATVCVHQHGNRRLRQQHDRQRTPGQRRGGSDGRPDAVAGQHRGGGHGRHRPGENSPLTAADATWTAAFTPGRPTGSTRSSGPRRSSPAWTTTASSGHDSTAPGHWCSPTGALTASGSKTTVWRIRAEYRRGQHLHGRRPTITRTGRRRRRGVRTTGWDLGLTPRGPACSRRRVRTACR
jgi:hypothetical protein